MADTFMEKMSRRLLIGVVALTTMVGVATAHADRPPLRVLAKARGHGSVTVATRTSLSRVVFVRSGGVGVATGRAQFRCWANETGYSTGTDAWDTFKIKPNGRHELWRRNEIRCRVSVTVAGRGTLDVSLRGD
jgi:hypothetical protein